MKRHPNGNMSPPSPPCLTVLSVCIRLLFALSLFDQPCFFYFSVNDPRSYERCRSSNQKKQSISAVQVHEFHCIHYIICLLFLIYVFQHLSVGTNPKIRQQRSAAGFSSEQCYIQTTNLISKGFVTGNEINCPGNTFHCFNQGGFCYLAQ